MVLPKQTILVLDPGVGMVEPAATSPLYTGPTLTGTLSQLYSFSDIQTVRSTLGYGEMAEDVMKAISERGGPVLAMRTGGSIAPVTSVITKSGAGPTITVAGTPNDNYT